MNILLLAARCCSASSPASLCARRGRDGGLLPLPLLWLFCLLLAGCAASGVSSVNRMLDSAGNMSVARHYLGDPHVSRKAPGGGTQYEWNMNQVVRESAHYETRRVLVGHDRDGYPVFEDIEYYIPDRDVHRTCRIVVLADAQDSILEHRAEGSHCHLMYRVPTTY